MKYRYLLFLMLICLSVFSQEKQNNLHLVIFDYTHQFPFADLAETYGDNSSISMEFLIKNKSNLLFGIDAAYLFGEKVKPTDLLKNIATENGEIINKEGLFSNVLLYERGFSAFVSGGKAFLFSENSATGIYLSAGLGYLQHKIRIQTQEDIIPSLDDQYKKGYDRLTGGFGTKINANYIFFSKKNSIKLLFGLEFIEGFTKNLRPYNFDTMQATDKDLRNDMIFGIKGGIIIPIAKRNTTEYHYY